LSVLGTGYGALRLRLVADAPWRSIRHDLEAALVIAVGQCAVFAVIRPAASFGQEMGGVAIAAGVISLVSCLSLRLMMRLWDLWEVTRVKRLRWSVAHAQLMTFLALVTLFAASQAWTFWRSLGAVIVPLESPVSTLLLLLTVMVTALVASMPILVGLMLFGVATAYAIARPIARRIEVLAAAVSRVRDGDYQSRVEVSGEDEVAQLQRDFNAMTADMARALDALKAERDTVTGLLDARRALMASVSHELRTPIASIRGYLDAALARWQGADAPPPTLRHDLQIVTREAIRLQRLIDDLFALSRAEVGRLTLRCTPTEIAPLIQGVVEASAGLAWDQRRVKVSADLPPVGAGALVAWVDAPRLEQILWNLLHNALRHTPPGGIVSLSAWRASPNTVQVQVRDTGEGIAAEDLPHIWERFYRGRVNGGSGDSTGVEAGDGAGVGLAVVKDLIDAMQGTITVHSTPGQGCIFTLTLPTPPNIL
jgi:signal transduction histidine kinase